MAAPSISLDDAAGLTRTGDVWLFRGRKVADRAIQVATNSPVNHVGMSVVIDDLPPLMWHAELGRSLPDLWSGTRHRGVQLHDLRAAVNVWATRYGQHAWLRQLDPPVTREMEDAVLRTVARLDGTPFPSTAGLASRWLLGRVPPLRQRTSDAALETAYCAEVLAITYQTMGLLSGRRHASWYDAGRFWSGDGLRLSAGFRLGGEVPVQIPPVADALSSLSYPMGSLHICVRLEPNDLASMPARRKPGDGSQRCSGAVSVPGHRWSSQAPPAGRRPPRRQLPGRSPH